MNGIKHGLNFPSWTAGLALLAATAGPAQAQWFGSVGVTSNYIVRGLSQSVAEPSAQAAVGWRHSTGAVVSLGVATVSKEQFAGSDGYKLMPELAWSTRSSDGAWHGALSLRGQYFPGARGAWFGNLPPAAQNRVVQANSTDYGTLELGASLGYKFVTLSWSRSLSDYLGLATTETGPLGTKVLRSKGTTYLGLDVDWPMTDSVTLSAGVGSLKVPEFDLLSYTDWRLGVNARAWELDWSLRVSGSNADKNAYRPRLRNNSDADSAAEKAVAASVAWSF